MSDLRAIFEGLGHTNVRTLLNSGNVLFQSPRRNVGKLSTAVEAAIAGKCGFCAAVSVISANDLDRIIEENPLLTVAKDSSRHLIAFVAGPAVLAQLRSMLKESWFPDALAIGSRAAYLWCAAGVLDSKLSQAFARKAGASITTRNWTTVLKLQVAAKEML
jgi:uncharacterized protein (DUF1697 family)